MVAAQSSLDMSTGCRMLSAVGAIRSADRYDMDNFLPTQAAFNGDRSRLHNRMEVSVVPDDGAGTGMMPEM